MLSLVLRSEQAMGFAASDGVATSAPDTAMAEKNAQSGTRTHFVCWKLAFMAFLLVGLKICKEVTLILPLNLCPCLCLCGSRESVRGSRRPGKDSSARSRRPRLLGWRRSPRLAHRARTAGLRR